MEKTNGSGYKFHLDIRNKFVRARTLEQSPQSCGRIPITGDSKDAVGQGGH